jgi:guanylate kinase
LERRFKAALEEIAHHDIFDYLIVNDDLDVAFSYLKAVLMAERSRHCRVEHLAKKMLEV